MIPLAQPGRGDDRDDSRFAIVDIAQYGGGVIDHDPAVGLETLVRAADDGRARDQRGLGASKRARLGTRGFRSVVMDIPSLRRLLVLLRPRAAW